MFLISEATAYRRLSNRWHEQCERFPTMRRDIPLLTYIRANLYNVRRNGLLAAYDVEGYASELIR